MELKISGGKTIKCAMSDAGPLPAQSGPYKMEVAGMMLNQDEDSKSTSLIFTFGLRASTVALPTHIVVEDVSGAKAITVIDDGTPKFEKDYWKGNAAPVVLSEANTPWLFDGKPTIKVFKITISVKDAEDVIMYQPSWYATESKAMIIEILKQDD